MGTISYESLRQHYADLWASIEIRPSKAADIDATARKVLDAKNGRYKAVQSATSVPWFCVGIIHQLECGGNFAQHLHNGDSLAARTVHVPRGRIPAPATPPFTWKDSAIDAMRLDGLDKVGEWPIERILYQLELYNGTGYLRFHPDVNSPYLWSGTNHYSRGKYVEDGQWSSSAVSGQSGAAAILKRCMELDPDVCPKLEGQTTIASPADIEEKPASPADAFPKAKPPDPPAPPHPAVIASKSPTVWSIIAAGIAAIGNGVKHAVDAVGNVFGGLPDISDSADEMIHPVTNILGILKLNSAEIGFAVGLACLVIAVIRHVDLHGQVAASNGNS